MRGSRGIVPLVILLIVGGVAIVTGLAALLATGNGKQALSCVEQAINANPAAVGTLVSSLSAATTSSAAEDAAEGAVEHFGPALAICVLVDLWDDAKAQIARNAAIKAGSRVGSSAQITGAAQVACVAKGWYPGGMIVDGGAK